MCSISTSEMFPRLNPEMISNGCWRGVCGSGSSLSIDEEHGGVVDSWGAKGGVDGLVDRTGGTGDGLGLGLGERWEELISRGWQRQRGLLQGHRSCSDSMYEIAWGVRDSHGGTSDSRVSSLGVDVGDGGCGHFMCLLIEDLHILSAAREGKRQVNHHSRGLGLSRILKGRASSVFTGHNPK